MSNSVTFDERDRLITITLQGRLDQGMIRTLAAEVARIAKEYDCFLVLNDAREATSGLSTVEIYELPEVIAEIISQTGLQVNKFKRALVAPTDVPDFAFFETVSRNRGQNVVVFRSIEEAKSWLLGK